MDLFAQAFGWHDRSYAVVNVTENRPRLEQLSEQTRNLVLAHNSLDVALHTHYRRRLTETHGHRGPPR